MSPRPPRISDRPIVKAPRILGIDPSTVGPLLSLVAQIERHTLSGDGVDINMTETVKISRSAALILTAQLERSLTRSKGCLNGFSPIDMTACRRLHAFGFYKHLGFSTPPSILSDPMDDITVISGINVTPDLSSRLEMIADIATPIFGSSEFVEHIHEALSEAMANIMGHAYIKGVESVPLFAQTMLNVLNTGSLESLEVQARSAALERWWIAGHVDRASGELLLYALDHGHSIPIIAPFRMEDALEEFWSAYPEKRPLSKPRTTDAQLLEAVARARREGYGTGRRGRGFPSMIGLVEKEATSGAVTVLSGAALYEFNMLTHDAPATERTYPLNRRFPGTLIEWRIGGARVAGDLA